MRKIKRIERLEFRIKNRAGDFKTVGKFEIKNQTENSAELYVYGDIVSQEWLKWDNDDTCPKDVADFLKEIEDVENLAVYINSCGGSVFAGMAIYNQLKRYKANKTVYVDGLAGSIASVIMFSGDEIIVPANAFVMIHKPWQYLWGGFNSDEFRKMAEDLDRIEEGMLNVYEQNLKEGVDIETVKQLVKDETWLTGTEAAKYFNITAGEESNAAACISGYFNYKKIPEELQSKQKGVVKDEEIEILIERVNRTIKNNEELILNDE